MRVCPVEGIVLLKLLSWDDRNSRTKDLADIDTIIHSYFDLFSADIYDTYYDILLNNDEKDPDYTTLVCAEVIGLKMKTMLQPDPELHERIISILKKDKGEYWRDVLRGIQMDEPKEA